MVVMGTYVVDAGAGANAMAIAGAAMHDAGVCGRIQTQGTEKP